MMLAFFFLAVGATFSEGLSWIPLLQDLNLPDYAFGYLWSAMWGVTAIAPLLTNRLSKKNKKKAFIVKYTLIPAIITLLVYFSKTWAIAIAVMLSAEFFLELRDPVMNSYFHRFIPTKLRATIGSTKGMASSLATILALPVIGYLVDTIGARYTIMMSSAIMVPAIIAVLLIPSSTNNQTVLRQTSSKRQR